MRRPLVPIVGCGVSNLPGKITPQTSAMWDTARVFMVPLPFATKQG